MCDVLGQGEVLIRGLSRHIVGDTQTLMRMVKKGLDARSVGSTKVYYDRYDFALTN
jgi:hypothetical protein